MALDLALKTFLDRPAEARRLGPFHLLHPLGRGSFAPVWLAREVHGEVEIRRAAVKLFAVEPEAPGGSEAQLRRSRILEEARLFGQIEHPNLVRLFRLLPDEEPGIVGVAMEYADGASLEHRLGAQGKLPIDEVLSIGAAVASALSALHRAGLVHGDVKPANVIEASYVLKLIDVGSIDPTRVAEGGPATPASDLHALGATLFACLTGKLSGGDPSPPLRDVAPDAPEALARLVDALLSPTPEKRPTSAARVAMDLERVRAERAGRARALPPQSVGPFRGLGRFEQEHRGVYFGRSAEVAVGLEMLRSQGLVALVGASGSGTSSLARAGIAPRVGDGALGGWIKAWDVRITVPGHDPRKALTAAIADLVLDAAELRPEAIVSALEARAVAEGRGVLLVVDQLEELVTIAAAESGDWAADLLGRMADPLVPGVRALVAARRDLLEPLLALGGLGRVLPRGLLLVAPLSQAAWGEVIDQALAAYGYTLEDDALREALMLELKTTGAVMPLVQFALTALWKRRDQARRKITSADLKAIGGLAGALDQHADATLQEITRGEASKQAAARAVILGMTTPQGTRATRRIEELERDTAAPGVRDIVAQLEEARLVVLEEAGLRLSHDALLTHWGTLGQWLVKAREERLLAEALERDAAQWAREQDASLLWQKRRLAAAEERARLGQEKLSAGVQAFVRAGRKAERQRRMVEGAVIVSLIGLSVVIPLMGSQLLSDSDAENQPFREAFARAQESEQRAAESAREALRQRDLADQRQQEVEETRRQLAVLTRRYRQDLDELRTGGKHREADGGQGTIDEAPGSDATDGKEPGTLLAVAVGGTCAFAVNGVSKGTSASIRIATKAGTYSVTCKPEGGVPLVKTITVKPGETSMTAFRIPN
jgi:hypothetical protein